MKKIALLAAALGFAVSVHAQAPFGLPFSALGYDANLGHITGRMNLGEGANLDVGAGLKFDNGANDKFSMGISGFYLMETNNWGMVSNHLAVGGVFSILDQPNDNLRITAFGGFQPEVLLLDRIIVSTRFGVNLDLQPELVLASAGSAISIVNGVNFKLLF